MHIAVINRCTTLGDGKISFWVKACSQQLEEFCAAWNIPVVTCAFYSKTSNLPDGDVRVLSIVDDVAMAGVAGFHDEWAGTVSAQVQAAGESTSWVMSHECLEMTKDPGCNQWVTLPDGSGSIAVEVSDPVQGDTYEVEAEILGETRRVTLANYVLPNYFHPQGAFPFDRLRKLPAGMPAMTSGGYYIRRDNYRNVTNVFASGLPTAMLTKLANPVSRTLRRQGNRGAGQ